MSPLTNRFLSVIGSRTLGFGCRRYSRLFLATVGPQNTACTGLN